MPPPKQKQYMHRVGKRHFHCNLATGHHGNVDGKSGFRCKHQRLACENEPAMVTVEMQTFLVAYGRYIGGGLAAVGAVVYIKKYRE